MLSAATAVPETGAYYQAVFKSNASGMLKCCLALNTKQPLSCLKKHVIEVSRVEVLGGKYKKSQLECVKCGQVELIQIGFNSDRLAALCKKYASESCWKIAKQCKADCDDQLGSAVPEQHIHILHFSVPQFQDTEQVQPRCSYMLLIPIK